MRVHNEEILGSTAVSGTNAYTSDAIDLRSIYGYSITLSFTGTNVTGTAKLQAANTDGQPTASDWVDLPDSGSTANIAVDASTATKYLWNVGDCFYRWARAHYTNATNSSNLTVRATTKGT